MTILRQEPPKNLVKIRKHTESQVKVNSFSEIRKKISERFKFKVPNFFFRQGKGKKTKGWDGFIRLYDLRDSTFPTGLVPRLIRYLKSEKHEVQVDQRILPTVGRKGINPEKYFSLADGLNLYRSLNLPPEEFSVRKDQIVALAYAIRMERCLLISPTASGKSLIIYMIIRYYLEKMRQSDADITPLPASVTPFRPMGILLIVTRAALVEQMYADFEKYSQNVDPAVFSPVRDIHRIHSGMEKINSIIQKSSDRPVIISTWQSLQNIEDLEYFLPFKVVIGDEAHELKADVVNGIMIKKLTKARIRIGTTGTLDEEKVNHLILEGTFGPIKQITTTKEMIRKGHASNLNIRLLHLVYTKEERKALEKMKNDLEALAARTKQKDWHKEAYRQEMEFLYRHKARNRFIAKHVAGLEGNVMITFRLISHGKRLLKKLEKKSKGKHKIFFVTQKTPIKERERIRAYAEAHTGVWIIASIKLFSVGTNIKNLQHLVPGAPVKRKIPHLQSIGRVLRKDEKQNECYVWDIIDDLRTRLTSNYAYNHAVKRINIYEDEEFEYKIKTFKLGPNA